MRVGLVSMSFLTTSGSSACGAHTSANTKLAKSNRHRPRYKHRILFMHASTACIYASAELQRPRGGLVTGPWSHCVRTAIRSYPNSIQSLTLPIAGVMHFDSPSLRDRKSSRHADSARLKLDALTTLSTCIDARCTHASLFTNSQVAVCAGIIGQREGPKQDDC